MDEAREHRWGRGLKVVAGCALLVGAALVVPQSWLDRVDRLFATDREQLGAFDDEAARFDEALENGDVSAWSADQMTELLPHAGVRRALRAGPMTSDEVGRATTHFSRWTRSGTHEVEALRDGLLATCPRLEPTRLDAELRAFSDQVRAAREVTEPSVPGMSPPPVCSSCHAQTRPLPEGRRFDALGIYPHFGQHPALEGGRRLPLRTEAFELSDGEECTDCHVAHDEPGFAITLEERVENMGLWVSPVEVAGPIAAVEVKVRNEDAAHRVPAGDPRAAYVVTVEAREGGGALPLRFGKRLPDVLARPGIVAGRVFGRSMVGADGAPVYSVDDAVNLVADTRLEAGRFAESRFVFDRRGEGSAKVDVTLWYLPDQNTWDGAAAVRATSETFR